MLEFRLGAGQSHVDLSVFFPRRIPNLPEKFLTHPAWQAVQDFCQEWIDQASFLYEGVTNVGLEFDLDQPLSEIPILVFLFLGTRKLSAMLKYSEKSFPDY
jgi:hypothetical protein